MSRNNQTFFIYIIKLCIYIMINHYLTHEHLVVTELTNSEQWRCATLCLRERPQKITYCHSYIVCVCVRNVGATGDL